MDDVSMVRSVHHSRCPDMLSTRLQTGHILDALASLRPPLNAVTPLTAVELLCRTG